MLKKILLLSLLLGSTATFASTCPLASSINIEYGWVAPQDWQEVYHHRDPKQPVTFANVSVTEKDEGYTVYCYYHGGYKNDKPSAFVIMRQYSRHEVTFLGNGWYTLYEGMTQCGTPNVHDPKYPTQPEACAW